MINTRWRHHSGRIYQVMCLANEDSTKPQYPVTVVYFNVENGKIWSRPLDDWARSFTQESEACDTCRGANYLPEMCCSGHECGCLGRPIDVKPCPECNQHGHLEPSPELFAEFPYFFKRSEDE